MISRGAVCWIEPPEGPRVPAVVLQADAFNRSRLPTVVVVPLSGNPRLAEAPGNTVISASASRLGRDFVANVAQPLTLDRRAVKPTPVILNAEQLGGIEEGIKLVLGLASAPGAV